MYTEPLSGDKSAGQRRNQGRSYNFWQHNPWIVQAVPRILLLNNAQTTLPGMLGGDTLDRKLRQVLADQAVSERLVVLRAELDHNGGDQPVAAEEHR